jgi:hypothetical protein
MIALALVLSFVAGQDAVDAVNPPVDAEVAAPEVPVEEPAPAPVDEWPGEARRVHFGVGYRGHLGMMESERTPFLVLQSELLGLMTVRLGHHNELRVQVGFSAGYPDTFAGESNVSFRWAVNRAVSVGVGVLAFWGFWSMRGGAELPIAIRFGPNRHHEITIALHVTAGVYNNETFFWYDFPRQRFAISGDLVAGYSFIF